MSSRDIDFITGFTHSQDKSEQDLSLCYAYPVIDNDRETKNVLTLSERISRVSDNKNTPAEDGLYVSENPLTDKIIKPYQLDDVKTLNYESQSQFRGKLLEIAVRDVCINNPQSQSEPTITITSVSILFKKKLICKTNKPFNRKLYKLLIRNSECHNLAIQMHGQHGESSILPLPLPKHSVQNHKLEIVFAITSNLGKIYSGVVTCTISLSTYGSNEQKDSNIYSYRLSNDPNDPQNSLSLLKPEVNIKKKDVKYFSLEDPALVFDVESNIIRKTRTQTTSKPPDIVVAEQSAFSLIDISFKNFFQANRPLKPSSRTRRHHTMGKTVLSVTVLRGVEIPVREESALVSPFLEVQWGDVTRLTSVADGPAPVWQQTIDFDLPKQNDENCVKFRLYDQHPVWGQQWLGEARIPLEWHRNYQELERWIALSPLYSPILLFGYVQASPGQSHTRIYVLMRMEHSGNAESMEANAVNTLLKGIQRCLSNPYKIVNIETPDDAARLTMLLSSLPAHYGPIAPRQALNVNKIDHYGRAALLVALLQGFGLQSYVLLGSTQISKWTAFALSIDDNNVTLWDPEIGDYYKLSDNRCSLTRVSHLINHSGIWDNLQRSILPHNSRYNVTISKDWRLLPHVSTSVSNRSVQTLELNITAEEDAQEKKNVAQMEQLLRDKLCDWRSAIGLTTVFNRHAISVLRNFIADIPIDTRYQLDKRDLKQLHRAYHIHGFLLNLRQTAFDEITKLITATKVHNITGPIEFAVVSHVQRYIGKTCSIWLAVAVLRNRG